MAGSKAVSGSTTPFLTHAPNNLVKLWFLISTPLIAWDSGYALMRPWTMEGGFLHAPLWTPYKLYGEVDHVYGWKYFNANNGFTSAQSFMNCVEYAMYLYYYWMWYSGGVNMRVAGGETKKVLVGRQAGIALLIAFSAATMTVSKSILYWLCDYFSGWDNIGHNDFWTLLIIFIIPNIAWIIVPGVLLTQWGAELANGLSINAPAKYE